MYNVFAQAARTHGIYVIGCIYERDKGYVYNTAFLLDRRGQLVGKYRKKRICTGPKCVWESAREKSIPYLIATSAASASRSVYDSWFPEVARVLVAERSGNRLLSERGLSSDRWRRQLL